jgi:hypothetical protein
MFYRTPYIKRKGLKGRGTSVYLPFAADMVWKHTKNYKGGMNIARRNSDGKEFLIKDLKKNGRYLPLANNYRKQFKLKWDKLTALQKSSEISRIVPRVTNRKMKVLVMRYARNLLQKNLKSPYRKMENKYKTFKVNPYSYKSSFSRNPFKKWSSAIKKEAIDLMSKIAVTLEDRLKTRRRLNKESFSMVNAEEIAWENTDDEGGGLNDLLNPYTKEKVEYRYYVSDKGKFNNKVLSERKKFYNHISDLDNTAKIKFFTKILSDISDSKEKKIVKDYINTLKTSDEG